MIPRLLLVPLLLATACTTIYTSPADQAPSDERPDGDPDKPDKPRVEGQVVFVTSAVYQGGYLGGLEGADAACATRATAAGLRGTFKAWLSDAASSAADRLTQSTRPYVLVDGTKIANDWADLTHADLQHTINMDETGNDLADPEDLMIGGPVWTGTEFDGRAVDYIEQDGENCGGWRDLRGFGLAGDRSKATKQWTLRIGLPCTVKAALYCIEQ